MFSKAFLLATLVGIGLSTPVPAEDELTVKTSSGIINGFVDKERFPGVRQFQGIPFGRPPLGPLRWASPEPFQSNQTIKAHAPPPGCPQIATVGPALYTVSSPEFLHSGSWDEDCLGLSVWAPTVDACKGEKEKLPVFIWIHGGGLQTGSESVAYQVPMPWVQRSASHIVVSLQYRLNVFGFPNAAGLNKTNFGIEDQRLGIEWVRDNIEQFGGDPKKIVLWGQSAGAGSTDAHNYAFPDDPIVSGFIANSGSTFFPLGSGFSTSDPTHSNFSTVAKGLGCPSDPAGELKCMQTQPAERIIAFQANYTMANTIPMLNFIATPDDRLVFANYTERLRSGKISKLPAIFGSTANEAAAQAPFPTEPTVMGPDAAMIEHLTLTDFLCPAHNSITNRTAVGLKSYQYLYAGNFTDVSPLFWEGAYHMGDLPMIFGTRGSVRAPATDFEIKTSQAMQDLWLAFARDPQNPKGWEEASGGKVLMLGGANSDPSTPVDTKMVNGPCAKAGLS